jgi:hypothetical protein
MKKFFSFLSLTLLAIGSAFGQCTADPNVSLRYNSVFPQVVNATNGQALSPQVLTVVFRRDSVVAISAGGQNDKATIRYYQITFDSLTGFPTGLPAGSGNPGQATTIYATSSPSSLVYNLDVNDPADSAKTFCVTLSGTPTSAAAAQSKFIAQAKGKVTLGNTFYSLARPLCNGFGTPLNSATFDLDSIPVCFSNPNITSTFDPKPLAAKFKRPDFYRLVINVSGTTAVDNALTGKYDLKLFPNPATSESVLSFVMNESNEVRVELLDVAGRSVGIVQNGTLAAGSYNVSLDLSSVPQGIYMVRTSIGGAVGVSKLVKN